MRSQTVVPALWRLDPDLDIGIDDSAELTAVAVVADDQAVFAGIRHLATGRDAALVVVEDAGGLHLPPVAGADPRADVRLRGVAVTGDEVWAVGSIVVGGDTRPRIERYNRWAPQVGGQAAPVVPAGVTGELRSAVALGPQDVWAVGATAGEPTQPLIVHYDGSDWMRIPGPNLGTGSAELNSVAARAWNDVWAVGRGRSPDPTEPAYPLVLHWDGHTWLGMDCPGSGIGDNELHTVAVAGPDDVWCAGSTPTRALALHYDGAKWTDVGPADVTRPLEFTGIAVVSGTDIFLTGYGPRAADDDRDIFHIEHWDGCRLRVSPIEFPITPDYPASGLTAISAGPGPGPLLAVGWQGSEETPSPAILRYG